MLQFCSLYSSSEGNCFYVSDSNTHILVDAGVSLKKIELALESIGSSADMINAIIVTHEHTDHSKSLGTISKKYNIPIYANKPTWDTLDSQKEKIAKENQKLFVPEKQFSIGDLSIYPFRTPHDAVCPCGFNIKNKDTKISIATDLGHMDSTILKNLENSSFVLLESNYDTEVLRCCSYPFSLKSRISSPSGHLSNSDAGKTVVKLLDSGLKEVMLGHLSKESNFPELAYQTVLDEIDLSKHSQIPIHIASRSEPSKVLDIA